MYTCAMYRFVSWFMADVCLHRLHYIRAACRSLTCRKCIRMSRGLRLFLQEKMKVKGHMLAVCQSGSYAKKNAPNVKQHANYFTSL